MQWKTSVCNRSSKYLIEVKNITGSAKGDSTFIPCISMIPSDYQFEFKRMHFLVKVCFAMRINKSQNKAKH